jgi:hypothetical protein
VLFREAGDLWDNGIWLRARHTRDNDVCVTVCRELIVDAIDFHVHRRCTIFGIAMMTQV